jgi:hypothetical protein
MNCINSIMVRGKENKQPRTISQKLLYLRAKLNANCIQKTTKKVVPTPVISLNVCTFDKLPHVDHPGIDGIFTYTTGELEFIPLDTSSSVSSPLSLPTDTITPAERRQERLQRWIHGAPSPWAVYV